MIDIHAHILPGVDDGAEDIYDTLEMVKIAAESGVTGIVATPHCNIPGVYENYFGDSYVKLVEEVRRRVHAEKIPVNIYPGAEAFATPELPRRIREGRIMPLNQSHYLLMEFAFDEDPAYAVSLADQVRETGAIPVIAHAERYEFVQDDPRLVYEWRKKGYLIQVNKGSFGGIFGKNAQRMAYHLMDHRLVSVIASDAHGAYRRTPDMAPAFEALVDGYPEEYLRMLFWDNPRRICLDQKVAGADKG